MKHGPVRHQRGTMTVEFGLGSLLLFMALIGAVEVGRLLWTWNAAAEATRLGARLAAVCAMGNNSIKARMRERLPALTDDHITLEYLNPGGVGVSNAVDSRLVRVSLHGYTHQLLVPLPSSLAAIPISPFTTTMPREVLANNQPACSA
ncbi:TadE/TadG family type IV pilus assembly protein [Azohydromonas caseinilytica]|uniref:Pilus assembly protein n=1 Tax=Azohydromonas caseinilytica TaxID=2728836 RepID=A0A848F6U6_9BURK|nr:TadE family protein [Azohydromonas caseinilytica]NML15304.1 pilus assembly protein [Azohydromonas caseinilytica]